MIEHPKRMIPIIALLLLCSTTSADPVVDWSRSFGTLCSPNIRGLVTNGEGNSFAVGDFNGTLVHGDVRLISAGERDIFVVKLDPAGDWLWARRYGGERDDYVVSVSIDASDDLCIAGHFASPEIDFGSGPLVASGDYDVFVAKLTTHGSPIWSRRFGDAGPQQCTLNLPGSPGDPVILSTSSSTASA